MLPTRCIVINVCMLGSATRGNFTVCAVQSHCPAVTALPKGRWVTACPLIWDEAATGCDFHLDCGVLIEQIPSTSMGDALYVHLCIFPQYKDICLHNAEMLKRFSCFHADSSFWLPQEYHALLHLRIPDFKMSDRGFSFFWAYLHLTSSERYSYHSKSVTYLGQLSLVPLGSLCWQWHLILPTPITGWSPRAPSWSRGSGGAWGQGLGTAVSLGPRCDVCQPSQGHMSSTAVLPNDCIKVAG